MKNIDKNQLRILIIEDDLIIAENLKENLMDMGYRYIDVVSDSKEAISLYRQNKPDLCLVDIQLTRSPLDGIETMEKLEAGKEIPVIYLTSFIDDVTRERAKKTNPSAYLVKPANKIQIDVAIDIAVSTFFRKPEINPVQRCSLHT
jgi:CheY-like chemotaxis protein